MALINPLLGSNLASTGFDTTLIGNSVWLDGSADLFTKSSFAGHASKKVISVWVQRTGFSSFGLIRGTNSTGDRVGFGDNVLNNQVYVVVNGKNLYSNGSFRDIGWYHYLVSFDLTQSTASDKVKVYINSVDLDSSGGWQTDERSTMSSSFGSFNSAAVAQQIGRDGASSMYLNAYLAQYCELDGQSIQSGDVATTDFYDTFTFGTNGSQIIPKKDSDIAALATAAGSNSFCLDFSNSADLGNDISSNNNDFTATSMSSANQSSNTPSKVYPFMNPLDQDISTATALSDGNLKVSMGTAAGDGIRATMQCSGKIYFEVEIDSISTNSGSFIGIATSNHDLSVEAKGSGNRDAFVGVNTFDSNLCGFISGSNFDSSYGGLGNNFGTAGKYLMFAVDIDAGKFWGGYDGTWFNSGDPAAGSNDSGKNLSLYDGWMPAISRIGSAGSEVFIFNFGQSSFAHTPPTGFVALNSANLTAPDYQGIDYFNAVLHTGNASTRSITGVGFQPDLIWMKDRDNAANFSNSVTDAVRGVTQHIYTDSNRAELTSTSSQDITSFDADGFSLASANTNILHNANTVDYVSWNFLAGGAGSSNTDGSISSTVSVATPGHFSIGTYVGSGANATIGHGLGGAPEMIIVKNRDQTDDWPVYHVGTASDPETDVLYLNYTLAVQDSNFFWNDTAPTSSVFSIGTGVAVNTLNENYVFYAFRSVPGVCKLGTYVGNNTDDNAYVSLGFKPRFFMCKMITGSSNWHLIDSARSPINEGQIQSFANLINAEQNSALGAYDLLSDGIKIRSDAGYEPGNTGTWLYMAVADIAGGGTLPPIYGR
ncbi:MAG: hypothetical protein VW443_07945 [Pseudomonadales bacterium]